MGVIWHPSTMAKYICNSGSWRYNFPFIPYPYEPTSITDRIDTIMLAHAQDYWKKKIAKDTLSNLHGAIEKNDVPGYKKAEAELNRLKKKYFYTKSGREELADNCSQFKQFLSRYPDFSTPERIPQILRKKWSESPKKAGKDIENYLAFNQTHSFANWGFREIEKGTSLFISIPNTDDRIECMPDAIVPEGTYEFKATTKERFIDTLMLAICQVMMYDFAKRLNDNNQRNNEIIVEIFIVEAGLLFWFNLMEPYAGIPQKYMDDYIAQGSDAVRNIYLNMIHNYNTSKLSRVEKTLPGLHEYITSVLIAMIEINASRDEYPGVDVKHYKELIAKTYQPLLEPRPFTIEESKEDFMRQKKQYHQ